MKKITLVLLILSLSYSLEHYYEDGKASLYFFNKAVKLVLELYGENDPLLVSFYHRIGTVYHGKFIDKLHGR